MPQPTPKQNDIPAGYVPLLVFCETHHLDICRMMTLYDRGKLRLKTFLLAEDTPVYILSINTKPPEYAQMTDCEKKRKRRGRPEGEMFVRDKGQWVRPYSKSELARQMGVTPDQMRRFVRKMGYQERIPKAPNGATIKTIPPSLFDEMLEAGKRYFAGGMNKRQSKYANSTKGE